MVVVSNSTSEVTSGVMSGVKSGVKSGVMSDSTIGVKRALEYRSGNKAYGSPSWRHGPPLVPLVPAVVPAAPTVLAARADPAGGLGASNYSRGKGKGKGKGKIDGKGESKYMTSFYDDERANAIITGLGPLSLGENTPQLG